MTPELPLLTKLSELETAALSAWSSAKTPDEQDAVYSRYLGRKGELATLFELLPGLSPEERRAVGPIANSTKARLAAQLRRTTRTTEVIDSTVPSYPQERGSIHPITAMREEMELILRELSFKVVEGNELITEEENFDSLNLGPDHPARDGHDSFFVGEGRVLRTQTTAIQVNEMRRRAQQGDLPIRIVMPGKTYRRESDQTHSAMFHQIDAVMVDTQTTFSDLKGILDYFVGRLFHGEVETRFRPHHFPFTEPSAEIDIRLKTAEAGEGRHTRWLEFGGCGMIHPAVLARAGLNPKVYQGWAFGMSIERPIMVRHRIPDLRLLFANGTNLLEQFPVL